MFSPKGRSISNTVAALLAMTVLFICGNAKLNYYSKFG